ncbi:hypothetical protein EJ066_07415 [Mesorhizobium sp. M9A.F.Ca.ET.002.03.1.2]|uniref:hypothetical protein n=1 Tax=Mesorhizobium sp. M9A.F.Ca.ET.002.03.1.2 TaxID=2493668 RepID=UPI000F763629|nr:hypothetical protein [Mesorhizobium sp. M9A.F.Ca.ET.002.03.1.2]AZN97128.1 hypothetical protein EJ066_07415 [Mesorhizobium sp. M9A.F.Ca.ET.002.03.1.2]
MDSLKIQDVFEPYYAGRKRFAARKDKSLPARADVSSAKKPRKRHPSKATNLEIDPSTDTGSTMEH